MKAVILAGGYGTRISEESDLRPKPMIEIGGRPILWHIMKIYSAHGINDFVICCGYKGHMIKEYFNNYWLITSDVTFDLQANKVQIHQNGAEPWRVTVIDTGNETMTGGRLKKVKEYVGDETFCFTYGDGLSDIDIKKLIEFHRAHEVLATVTGIQPPGRYGALGLREDEDEVRRFIEKPIGDGSWVNGGFFVLEAGVFEYIEGDFTHWEREPMQNLARDGMLAAYRHDGFWHPMDTLRDKRALEEIWASGDPPWKIW